MGIGTSAARIAPMKGAFGATVTGIDASRALDVATIEQLLNALWEHRILVVEDQTLTDEQYLRFGRMWGPPLMFFRPEARHGEHPELIKIRNSSRTRPEQRDGAM